MAIPDPTPCSVLLPSVYIYIYIYIYVYCVFRSFILFGDSYCVGRVSPILMVCLVIQ